MLTNEDIVKIIEAEKEVFPTKTDFSEFRDEMKESFSGLETSVDTYAKKADTYFQEMAGLKHKVDRLEEQVKKIADKVGIKFE